MKHGDDTYYRNEYENENNSNNVSNNDNDYLNRVYMEDSTATFSSEPESTSSVATPSVASQNVAVKEKTPSATKCFLMSFVGAALACVLVLFIYDVFLNKPASLGESNAGVASIVIDSEDPSLAEAVSQKCLPSVCSIDVYVSRASLYGPRMGSGTNNDLEAYSLGSGVVLSEDGYVLTNYHVIEGGEVYYVTVAGDEYEAELVGQDESSDLAVLKLKGASGLTPMEIGDSDELVIGEWVMSIGCPFGLEQSVATGIVSATSRSQVMDSESGNSTTLYVNMIQTDAAINPGNSGGALVDADGKLIGINTLITSYSGNYSGVGFAIPVNYAISIANQIIAGETPTHAKLGVNMISLNSSLASRYDLPVNYGAYVTQVESGSAADQAGVEEGDTIISFNGVKISSGTDLMLEVRSCVPGDTVDMVVMRGDEELTLEVTLGNDASQEQTIPNLLPLN